ncbi:translation initiation factor IF-2-like isoform X2 [Camelus ferus]|uniref:Translation initiation factor IF-2-like isoform X2 n=1 Tax=Camelus ferus TaxID=419612 RepID=A0A8B8SM23_CAMFR|nr:translation initiation factor IF-2-like isoform X2 [Camelus ferus]
MRALRAKGQTCRRVSANFGWILLAWGLQGKPSWGQGALGNSEQRVQSPQHPPHRAESGSVQSPGEIPGDRWACQDPSQSARGCGLVAATSLPKQQVVRGQAEARALPVAPCESPGAAALATQTDSSHPGGRLEGPGLPVSTRGPPPTQRTRGSTGAEHIPTPRAVTSLQPAHTGQPQVGDGRGTGPPRGGVDGPRCTGRPEPRRHAPVRRQGRARGAVACEGSLTY